MPLTTLVNPTLHYCMFITNANDVGFFFIVFYSTFGLIKQIMYETSSKISSHTKYFVGEKKTWLKTIQAQLSWNKPNVNSMKLQKMLG